MSDIEIKKIETRIFKMKEVYKDFYNRGLEEPYFGNVVATLELLCNTVIKLSNRLSKYEEIIAPTSTENFIYEVYCHDSKYTVEEVVVKENSQHLKDVFKFLQSGKPMANFFLTKEEALSEAHRRLDKDLLDLKVKKVIFKPCGSK